MYDHVLKNVPVVVSTSDKYLPALKPFMWLAREYWSREKMFNVFGFSPPEFKLESNFTFTSIGKFEDYPIKKWTTALIQYLENHVDSELFILMLEDYWVVRRVSHEAISLAATYMERNPNILKFDLCADRMYAQGVQRRYDYFGFLDICKSDPQSPYHMSLMTGIWRKELMLEFLKKQPPEGWSPHDVEISGTSVLSQMTRMEVVGSEQWPIRHTLGLRAMDHTKVRLDELRTMDRNTLTTLGYFRHWGIGV